MRGTSFHLSNTFLFSASVLHVPALFNTYANAAEKKTMLFHRHYHGSGGED